MQGLQGLQGLGTAFTMDTSSIKFGVGATQEIGYEMTRLGVRRVMVVTDPKMAQTEPVSVVMASLKAAAVDAEWFDRVQRIRRAVPRPRIINRPSLPPARSAGRSRDASCVSRLKPDQRRLGDPSHGYGVEQHSQGSPEPG